MQKANEMRSPSVPTEVYPFLVDRNEIAHILGVVPTAVSNYVAGTSEKHIPFPEPVISRSMGRFRLWDVDEVEAWHTYTFPNRAHLWADSESRLKDYRSTD